MVKIYFSVLQAEELAKKIRIDAEKMFQLHEELHLIDNTRIELFDESVEGMLLEVELNKSFHEKNLEMYSLLGYLIRQGCIVRNMDDKEIDFLYKLNDQDIFLCWRPEEEKISFWHFLNENKGQRKPIKLLEANYLRRLEQLK